MEKKGSGWLKIEEDEEDEDEEGQLRRETLGLENEEGKRLGAAEERERG